MRSAFGLLCGLMCLISVTVVGAAEYTGPEGFSLTYPDEWVVFSKHQQEAARLEARKMLDNMDKVDLSGIAVMIARPNDGVFAENINVAVGAGGAEVSSLLEQQYVKGIKEELGRMGLSPINIRSERITVGNRKAISVHSDLNFPGLPERMHQWQVIIPTGNKTCVLTCSALVSDFDEVEPLFAEIVNSMRVKGGLLDGVSVPVRLGIIGGLLGGFGGVIIALIWILSRKKNSAAYADGLYPREPAAGNPFSDDQSWNS